ncbi:MAG: serine--tRNA ligase [Candidatus Dojkabacteria bacterium]|jgi:seryl-tRNA synthetase
MIDVKRIIEDRDNIEQGLLKRLSSKEFNLDEIVKLYEKRKDLQLEFDTKRAKQKEFNDQMATIDKNSDEYRKLLEELKERAKDVKEAEQKLKETEKELISKLEVLPNIPDEDVIAGGKENNEVVREFKEKPVFEFEIKDHVQLGNDLDILDFQRATKISGNNFSIYKGLGARLEWALINYFIDHHLQEGYEMIIPPNLVTRDSAYTAGQLPKFEDDVYWTKDEMCLIPTAETVLTNIFRDEILDEDELPKKFFAYTPCYRKEAGSYRANEKGLIRMHQFNKVEIYQFVKQEDSPAVLDKLVKTAETLVEGLQLHYRTTKLAAGDCSAGAAKTYDIEVYIPSIEQYYEVSSASNVREYQSRRGNMRYRTKDDSKLKYIHTLNASGLATSRLMVALLESYQQEDGSVVVPEVLRKYIGVDKITK